MPLGEMMSEPSTFVLMFVGALLVVMYRLHRLGKQLEGVANLVQIEIASLKGEEAVDDVRVLQRGVREEERKDARQFWWAWGIIGAVAVAWLILSKG